MHDLYEIRIRGTLSDAARSRLADALRAFEPVETVMRGRVADQAELGCELLEARVLTAPRRR